MLVNISRYLVAINPSDAYVHNLSGANGQVAKTFFVPEIRTPKNIDARPSRREIFRYFCEYAIGVFFFVCLVQPKRDRRERAYEAE